MAARRLVIVMLVLLGISTLAAALVPAPDRDRAEEQTAAEDRPEQKGQAPAEEPQPQPDEDSQEPEQPEEPLQTPADPLDGGETVPPAVRSGLVYARVDFPGGEPQIIRVLPGSQVNLVVTSSQDEGDNIVLPDFGLTDTVSEYGPARFDVLIEEAGRYEIRAQDAGELIGTIVAAAPSSNEPPSASPQGEAPGPSRSSGTQRPGQREPQDRRSSPPRSDERTPGGPSAGPNTPGQPPAAQA